MDKYLIVSIVILSLFFSLLYVICLYKILIKEKIKAWLAFIPFVNIYLYLKICKLPFWAFFIPVVNIIVLIFSPFRLAKQYRLNRIHCYLSIIFPFVYLPFIAFSKTQNIDIIYDNTYIKSSKDIDLLEQSLKNTNEEYIYDYSYKETSDNAQEITSEFNEQDDDIFFDDIVYDNIDEEQNAKAQKDNFIEIKEFNSSDISIDNIDLLDDNLIIENSVEKNITTDIKEYQEEKPTTEAIAFGGEKKIENVIATQTKNDELKCKRCGSSLVGAKGYCPGCGNAI